MSAEVAILTVQLQVAEARADEAETRADHAEARAEQAEARAKQAKSYAKAQVEQAVARAERAEARADRAEARADRAEASCDGFILELGEQIRSIGQLREEFRIQREADRAMVERNLRGLLALHQSSFSELRGLKEKTSKSQRATSNRFRIMPINDGLPENTGRVSGRHNQATKEQATRHFNHSVGKQARKTHHKRTYEQFKADKTTITDVLIKRTMVSPV